MATLRMQFGNFRLRVLILPFAINKFKKNFGYRKDHDGYAMWMAGNSASGGAVGATGQLFVYSLAYARTRLANDAKNRGQLHVVLFGKTLKGE